MAGVEKIKEKILLDSEEKATAIIASAKSQAEEILKKANANAAARVEEMNKKAQHEANDKKRILNSMAELETRNDLLKTKQEIIEKVFDAALQKLSSIEPVQYKEMLKNMMLKAVETGEEEVVLSSKDKGSMGADFIAEVNAALAAAGKPAALKLSEEAANIKGGFLLKSKGIEINNSFEALVRMHRDEIEPKVAELLF